MAIVFLLSWSDRIQKIYNYINLYKFTVKIAYIYYVHNILLCLSIHSYEFAIQFLILPKSFILMANIGACNFENVHSDNIFMLEKATQVTIPKCLKKNRNIDSNNNIS